MLKTNRYGYTVTHLAYHLGEGRMLKTSITVNFDSNAAYHLGEGRMLKTR